jgi:nucleoside-diphosphate-sugar epimerase
MKVLVTGGAGYVGMMLVPLLMENGYEVRVLDNLTYTGTGLLPLFRKPGFEFVNGDVRDLRTVQDAVKGCDIVVHLAAIVGFPACRRYPQLAEEVNVGGAKNIAAALGADRLVLFGSTGSNYGAVTDQVCTEETPLNPVSLYAQTKATAERHLLENCKTVAYRFATGFGLSPRMRLDLLVNDFVFTALKSRYLVVYEKHFMRSFIHVYDMARAFLFAVDNNRRMIGEIYNVGAETMNYSKEQMCELIRTKVDYYIHYAEVGEDPDKRHYVVSYKKISDLGYRTSISLGEGIDELVRGMEALDVRSPYSNV